MGAIGVDLGPWFQPTLEQPDWMQSPVPGCRIGSDPVDLFSWSKLYRASFALVKKLNVIRVSKTRW